MRGRFPNRGPSELDYVNVNSAFPKESGGTKIRIGPRDDQVLVNTYKTSTYYFSQYHITGTQL